MATVYKATIEDEINYCKELLKIARKNKQDDMLFTQTLITLFESPVISSCFPLHEQIVSNLKDGLVGGLYISSEDKDITLLQLNACIKDNEKALQVYNYNDILYNNED
ncbi:hypothetical protein [Clostridium perfringens]|uniref:hypothetical protein n=1 Tax=Clostridium perfringens TaxID=1502 RepID=UPI0018E40B40|nr:hypothetical protein [Clostridium perfringens]MBI6042178.1 hypothetical protein [Clostridium perfringens]